MDNADYTFANRIRVATSTTGTGTLTLGTPLIDMQAFSGNLPDGALVTYTIEDGPLAWEVGSGTYHVGLSGAADTLTRDLVESSTNANALIVLSGNANVYITPSASWLNNLQERVGTVLVQDTPPVGAHINTLWWDSAGTGLYVNYDDGNSIQWVLSENQSNIAGVLVADTPPTNAAENTLWWDSTGTGLYVKYNDGTSTQWVVAQNQNTLTDAASDGNTYGRYNGTWKNLAAGGAGSLPFLPLTGGTVSGPLNYTATGGTVARSAQDRAADVANVLDFGADPTGGVDSAAAFRAALATGHNVWAPAGTYLITGQLTLATANGSQSLRGDGLNTILLVDTRFDPSVTTGVILLTGGGAAGRNDYQPLVSDLTIKFVQPTDLVKTATAASGAGTNTITVNSTSGIVAGMSVLDKNSPAATPNPAYLTWPTPLTVASIAGNVITLSGNLSAPGVVNGDVIQFAAVRSMFKTLAAGGTVGPGGSGVQYPWAIYNSTAQTATIRNVMVINAWNGIYIRGSAFRLDTLYVGAFNIGLDVDQCYNFPSISSYSSWQWGFYNSPAVVDALANVYYDGQTVAANFGETDGCGIHNFQTWAGKVNLTAAWTWGSFTNLMLDGNNANLNILSSGGGFVQISNLYCSKGSFTQGTPLVLNAGAGFQAVIANINMGTPSGNYSGISVQAGNLTLSGGYLWNGMSSAVLPFINLAGGTLQLNDMQLDASAGRVNSYVALSGTAVLHMNDCAFVTAPGANGKGIDAFSAGTVRFSDVLWNGWIANLPAGTNNQNNGAVFVAPLDATSMQSGSVAFGQLGATNHFHTAFGALALDFNSGVTSNNTAIGALAGYACLSSSNTFIGATSGYSPAGISGSNNTCLGNATGYNLTSGANNTLLGQSAGSALTTGSSNILIGNGIAAPLATTSNYISLGGIYTATGTNTPATSASSVAGSLAIAGALSAAGTVSGAGFQPMIAPSIPDSSSLQLGSQRFNTVFGATAHNSTAYGNLALGQHVDAGSANTALGALAGYGVVATANNTFIGATSGYSPGGMTGGNNTCLGAITGYSLTSGGNNTLIGVNAGASLTTGSGNIYIGDGTGVGGPVSESHALRIGTNGGSTIRATAIDTTAPKLFLDWLPASTTYANDAAAAAGGVGIGQLYLTSTSAVMCRRT